MATPTTTFHGAGPSNVFVPSENYNAGASEAFRVEFSRNPASFGVNRIAQNVPVQKIAGLYVVMDADDAVNVVNAEDFVWPDGNDAPDKENYRHLFRNFACERRAYPFPLGDLTVSQASWDIVAAHGRMAATKCMTDRTLEVMTLLTTSGNWPASNTSADLDALGVTGGSWDASATTENFIMASFHLAVEKILQSTGGVVQPGDITLTINPHRAHAMRQTAELNQYIVNNESSVPAWMQSGVFAAYGLPPQMFGVNINVDHSVRVSTRQGASTPTRAFILGDDVAVFTSRPGGLVGAEGPNFSTVVGFFQEDMTVENIDDRDNRRQKGRVVDNRVYRLTAPISGYLIQDVTT